MSKIYLAHYAAVAINHNFMAEVFCIFPFFNERYQNYSSADERKTYRRSGIEGSNFIFFPMHMKVRYAKGGFVCIHIALVSIRIYART